MNLYIVPRTRAWLSEEEVAAAADCIPAVNDTLRDHVRWIRSYVVSEDDGTFSALLHLRGDAARRCCAATPMRWVLPTDAIKPVAATVVAAPDPEPAGAA